MSRSGIKLAAGDIEADLEFAVHAGPDFITIDRAAKQLENFLRVSTEELKDFARLTGNDDIHKLSINDLGTTNSEISDHTAIEHV